MTYKKDEIIKRLEKAYFEGDPFLNVECITLINQMHSLIQPPVKPPSKSWDLDLFKVGDRRFFHEKDKSNVLASLHSFRRRYPHVKFNVSHIKSGIYKGCLFLERV